MHRIDPLRAARARGPGETGRRRATPEFWHRLLYGLLLAAASAACAAALANPDGLARRRWIELLALGTAVASTIASLTRGLPFQNVAAAAGLVAIVATGTAWAAAVSGVPFGPIVFTDPSEASLRHAPPGWLPAFWVLAILNARSLARLIMVPHRRVQNYGIWIAAIAAGLAAGYDLALEPFAVGLRHDWLWRTPGGWPTWGGAPWVNFLGWFVVATVIQLVITPWMVKAKPHPSPVDAQPLIVWAAFHLFVILNALPHGVGTAAWGGATVGVVVTALASWGWWSARSKREGREPAPER